jgi:hypothetical protein
MAYAVRTKFHLKELGCLTDQKCEKLIYVKKTSSGTHPQHRSQSKLN